MYSTKMLLKEKGLSQLYDKRHHLKHPIPYPMEIKPIGKTLTLGEWEKFCKQHLPPKVQHNCERKIDGTVVFIGEGGLDALMSFQEKFKTRFHLRMICKTKNNAIEWLQLAQKRGLDIQELHYKNGHSEIMLNDKSAIFKLIEH